MPEHSPDKPSFSKARRLGILFNVILSGIALFILVGMANYIASEYYKRYRISSDTRLELSPQTLKVLSTVTNNIEVTIFFDPVEEEELYTLVHSLLKEYNNLNPRVKVKTLDYIRFPGDAALLLAKHNLAGMKDRSMIIFDNNGQSKIIYQNQLSDYDINAVLSGETKEFRRNAFRGEMMFTSAIFSITHPRALKAYFLWGHGEHDPENATHEYGYGKFAAVLKEENNIDWEKLTITGTNDVPADCQLLIVAGPKDARLAENEISVIDRYLARGGRLLALIPNLRVAGNSGIEKVIAKWGVEVSDNIVADPENSVSGSDVLVTQINPEHPVTKTMFSQALRVQLVLPRSLGPVVQANRSPDAPKVDILAATSTNAAARYFFQQNGKVESVERQGAFGLIAAVEQGGIKGVSAERGATRILVVGDSLFLNNQLLDSAANHYFAGFAVNWLLAQPSILLEGLGPRPITEYKLTMSTAELRKVRLILLCGMPLGILALGGLVWMRRRS